MTAELQIKRVQDCQEWLEKSSEDYTSSQSISWLIDQLGTLCNAMAFVNNQMAVSKKLLNEAKVKAYNNAVLSMQSQDVYFSPMVLRDFINAKCSEEHFAYDVCERTSRSILHTIEALRTCISALKEESKIMSYAGNV